MAKKPLGKDQFGIQKVMRGGDYFADSMGQFALNEMWVHSPPLGAQANFNRIEKHDTM